MFLYHMIYFLNKFYQLSMFFYVYSIVVLRIYNVLCCVCTFKKMTRAHIIVCSIYRILCQLIKISEHIEIFFFCIKIKLFNNNNITVYYLIVIVYYICLKPLKYLN